MWFHLAGGCSSGQIDDSYDDFQLGSEEGGHRLEISRATGDVDGKVEEANIGIIGGAQAPFALWHPLPEWAWGSLCLFDVRALRQGLTD